MGRVAVFVDAGYLYKAVASLLWGKPERQRHELSLETDAALAALKKAALDVSGRELLRIYWYDGAPREGTQEHQVLAHCADLKIRLGHINAFGQQKGVDPLIVTDMITLARNRAVEDMVLVSGDGDLVVGVAQAQEHGVRVHLLGVVPARGNQAQLLRQEADTCHEWDNEAVKSLMRLASQSELDARSVRRQGRLARAPLRAREPASAYEPIPADKPSRPVRSAEVATATPGNGETARVDPQKVPAATPTRTLEESELQTAALDVFRRLNPSQVREIIGLTPGRVPGPIDRMLMGTAKHLLNTILSELDKRRLRTQLWQACKEAGLSEVANPALADEARAAPTQ